MLLFYLIILRIIIVLILFGLSIILTFLYSNSLEKLRSFECGLDSLRTSHNSFSTRFFLICILFLIFDIELCLLIPLIKYFIINKLLWFFLIFRFLLVLLLGSLYELNFGSIIWIKYKIK